MKTNEIVEQNQLLIQSFYTPDDQPYAQRLVRYCYVGGWDNVNNELIVVINPCDLSGDSLQRGFEFVHLSHLSPK